MRAMFRATVTTAVMIATVPARLCGAQKQAQEEANAMRTSFSGRRALLLRRARCSLVAGVLSTCSAILGAGVTYQRSGHSDLTALANTACGSICFYAVIVGQEL